jgi:hypothetical protein
MGSTKEAASTLLILTRETLVSFYEAHNALNVEKVDMILEKIRARVYSVQQVVDTCMKKYGAAPAATERVDRMTSMEIRAHNGDRGSRCRNQGNHQEDNENQPADEEPVPKEPADEEPVPKEPADEQPVQKPLPTKMLVCGEEQAKLGLSWAWAAWAAWQKSVTSPEIEGAATVTCRVVEKVVDNRPWRYTTERDCLLQLYRRNTGHEWRNKENWCDRWSVIDDWRGVETDRCGCVCRLNFYNQGLLDLQGFEVLKHLQMLESLSLFGNSDLTSVELLSELVQLKTIDLYKCRGLTDLSPLSGLKGLVALDIRYCDGISEEQRIALREKLPGASINPAGHPR